MSEDAEWRSGSDAAGALEHSVRLFERIRREGEWEAAQTHESLVPYLIEETWELADAIADEADADGHGLRGSGVVAEAGLAEARAELRSELGDVLLQLLFHSAIAAEHPTDPFDIEDVAQAMLDKLRARAPYWFDERTPRPDADEQDRLWQAAKNERRSGGVFGGVSWAQPALALGDKILARCQKAGVPEDVIPRNLTKVEVGAYSVFAEGESTEARYRETVRRFAQRVADAEQRIRARDVCGGHTREITAKEWRAELSQ